MVSQFFPTVVKFSPLNAAISETSISKILSRQHVALLAYQLSGLGVRVSATIPRRLRGLKEGAVHTTRPFFIYFLSNFRWILRDRWRTKLYYKMYDRKIIFQYIATRLRLWCLCAAWSFFVIGSFIKNV